MNSNAIPDRAWARFLPRFPHIVNYSFGNEFYSRVQRTVDARGRSQLVATEVAYPVGDSYRLYRFDHVASTAEGHPPMTVSTGAKPDWVQ